MCGFIGFTLDKDLDKYKNILKHRGSDSVSVYRDHNISLLHNRLSIIDLTEDAIQPMVDSDNGNVIVFNGEIYNYKELKKRFRLNCKTHSDTEVILKLYAKLGKNFIDQLKGIFSFVIYDNKSNKLLAFRDRFGVKPFYYKLEENNLSFSSEIKGILDEGIGINYQAVYEYLEFGLLQHNKDTFFSGIYSLNASHYIEYDLSTKKFEKNRYWDVSDNEQNVYNDHEILEYTYELLNDSIKLNLVSDVEVAISLSSGLDSTLLTKLAQNHQQQFKAFTFGFAEQDYDEVIKVKENFALQNLDLYPVYLKSEQMLDALQESIYYFESPLGGLGTLSAYNMIKEVREQNIKVILAGEGSDEVFGGYQYYYPAFFSELSNKEVLRKELQFYNDKHGSDIKLDSQEFQNWVRFSNTKKVLAPDGTTATNSHCGNYFDDYKQQEDSLSEKFSSKLHNVMYQDIFQKKLPKLLHFQDRASMAHSVEARVPFLDHDLVSFVYSLPVNYKIKNAETKYLLKEVLRKKFAYHESRITKHYVATPQREWLKDSKIRDQIIETIRHGVLMKNNLINFDKFYKEYMAYSKSIELGNSFFVWKIINLEYFMEQKWV